MADNKITYERFAFNINVKTKKRLAKVSAKFKAQGMTDMCTAEAIRKACEYWLNIVEPNQAKYEDD